MISTLSEAELVALGAGVVVERAHGHAGLARVGQRAARLLVPLVLVERIVLSFSTVLCWRCLVRFGRRCCTIAGKFEK